MDALNMRASSLWPESPVAGPLSARVPSPQTPVPSPQSLTPTRRDPRSGSGSSRSSKSSSAPTSPPSSRSARRSPHSATCPSDAAGRLQVGYVVWLSLVDAVLLVGLIVLFLRAHGERPRDVLFGRGRIADEIAYGVPLTLVVLGGRHRRAARDPVPRAVAAQRRTESARGTPRLAARRVAVRARRARGRRRPRRDSARVPAASLRGLAGRRHGRRDRHQRRRSAPGICCRATTPAIVTGLLGAFWGVIYLRRRSAVAPMVSHAGFDLLQILFSSSSRGLRPLGSRLSASDFGPPASAGLSRSLEPEVIRYRPTRYRSMMSARRRSPAIQSSTTCCRRSSPAEKR